MSKERENQAIIYGKEVGILGKAKYYMQRPMQSITAWARPTSRHGGWWRPNRAAIHQPKPSNFRPKAKEAIRPNPVPTVEVMDSPQQAHWKRAMEEEHTLILLKNTFTTINSREARQLRVKTIGFKDVYTTKHNPDGTISYKACLLIKGC